jgi:hypothetical protein
MGKDNKVAREEEKMQGIISMTGLIAYLVASIEKMKDPRQPSPNTTYSLKDAVLGGFSLFLMQCESFLEHQRQLHSRNGRDNLQTLFGAIKIPSDNQIRNILDKIKANSLFVVFSDIYQLLKTRGILTQYEVLDKQLLIPLDGTEYFSSQNIHCEQCSHRTHKNGTVTYFHSAILPVIVSPQQKAVISHRRYLAFMQLKEISLISDVFRTSSSNLSLLESQQPANKLDQSLNRALR